jgi:hypothetical protein
LRIQIGNENKNKKNERRRPLLHIDYKLMKGLIIIAITGLLLTGFYLLK